VIKLIKKKSKLSACFVLLAYLTITIANIYHHHSIDIGKLPSSLSSTEKNQTSHRNLNGSEFFCVVSFAYSSLHNSIISDSDPAQQIQNSPDFIETSIVSTKPSKENIHSFCLRAPPFRIS
jgi:hypothetical protein